MVWKDVPGYEGLYQASDTGCVRSVDGKVTSSRRFNERHWNGRVMKGRGDNYQTGKRVSLWKGGKRKDWLVARIVATTFLGEPPEGYTVNHKDGNRMNNAVDNLEWLSLADNIRHGFENGLYHTQKRVSLQSGGVTWEFRSMAEASEFLCRSKGYVSGCLKKRKAAISVDGESYTVIVLG